MAYSFIRTSNMYLSVESAPVIEPPLTMAAWIYLPNISAIRRVIALTQSGTNNRYTLSVNSTSIQMTAFGSVFGTSLYSLTTPTNTWIHVAGTTSSNTSRYAWYNGLIGVENTSNVSVPTPDLLQIGASLQTGVVSSPMDGYIAEVGIWNIALSEENMNALAKGYSPQFVRPDKLQFYAPLVRDLNDIRKGVTITNNNTATVIQHPRIYG